MPGFWGEQAGRLLRENWGDDAQALADELYAMANLTGPAELSRPIHLTQPDVNTPALVINYPNGTPVAPIQITFPAAGGGTTTVVLAPSGTSTSTGGTGTTPDQQQQNTSLEGKAFAGTIVGGSGTSYQVQIITEAGSQVVDGMTLSIASGDSVPAGEEVVVIFGGGAYRIIVPKWA